MKIFQVEIWLKGYDSSKIGWLVGRSAIEVANKVRIQPTVLLASEYRELKEAGYNMSEVQNVDGYNSNEIVTYRVTEYEVIPCTTK